MQLSSSEPCVVILTEKEVEVSVNNHATFTLPKNYLAAFACNNNVIELSTLNHVLITHINRNIINDYLLFLNKNLTLMNPLMILVKIIKLRWIHILSYDQMVSRKINNQTTRCANSIFYTTLFTNSAPNYT